ncbi:hypothetical protein [Mucilaginibacter koreensis]
MENPIKSNPEEKNQEEEKLKTQHPMSEKDEVKQAEENTTPASKEDMENLLNKPDNKETH